MSFSSTAEALGIKGLNMTDFVKDIVGQNYFFYQDMSKQDQKTI